MLKKRFIIVLLLLLTFNMGFVNAASINCGNTLKKGSTGNSVKSLQKRLNSVMGCNLVTDGVFGNKTYSCVVKFEKKYHLGVDGVVGKETCNKLNDVIDSGDYYEEIELSDGNYLIVSDNNGAKVYNSESVSSSVIKKINFGEVYEYEYGNKNWYKIKINNSYGYVRTKKIKTSFILVDIDNQRLQYMKHNEVIVDTNVVTGMMGKHDTPVGYYVVRKANKQRGRTLRGTNDNGTKYSAYVEYWMPFITSRAIGFHDASWRSSDEFNDSTYTYNGSHGCVNMPSSAAKKLYNAITYDEDVIVRD